MKTKIVSLLLVSLSLGISAHGATKKKPAAPTIKTAAAAADDCYTIDDVPLNGIGVCFDPSPSADVKGYHIEYGTSAGSYGSSTTLDAATMRGLLTGLDPKQQYFIVVTAFNDAGDSPASNEVSGYPKRPAKPDAPSNLRVIGSPEPARLSNLSTRGAIGAGDNVLIGGFVVEANARIALRAVSPSLAQYGLTAASGVSITLFDSSGNAIARNDQWQNGPDTAALVDLKLAPKDPRESALIASLTKGSYTAIVRGTGTQPSGIGMVEVFDVSN